MFVHDSLFLFSIFFITNKQSIDLCLYRRSPSWRKQKRHRNKTNRQERKMAGKLAWWEKRRCERKERRMAAKLDRKRKKDAINVACKEPPSIGPRLASIAHLHHGGPSLAIPTGKMCTDAVRYGDVALLSAPLKIFQNARRRSPKLLL